MHVHPPLMCLAPSSCPVDDKTDLKSHDGMSAPSSVQLRILYRHAGLVKAHKVGRFVQEMQTGMLKHILSFRGLYRTPSSSAVFCHALIAVCAHAIILLPLLRIPQGVVCFGHFLKLLGSILVTLRS